MPKMWYHQNFSKACFFKKIRGDSQFHQKIFIKKCTFFHQKSVSLFSKPAIGRLQISIFLWHKNCAPFFIKNTKSLKTNSSTKNFLHYFLCFYTVTILIQNSINSFYSSKNHHKNCTIFFSVF